MKQFVVTPAMGKRLIGKAVAAHPAVQAVLKKGTLVIIAGTTNGYVAEEILAATNQGDGFSRRGFRRGAVSPPGKQMPEIDFPGDVVLVDGLWHKGKTIVDVVAGLGELDVILKGANAVDLCTMRAAVYIGDPEGGTIGVSIPAVVGRRVKLIVPVGLEKRVACEVEDIAAKVNAPGGHGPRMLALPGEVVTELQAINILTGARADLLAGGGIYGAEGAVWLGISGGDSEVAAAGELMESLADEGLCEV
jgi:hypothetical protein